MIADEIGVTKAAVYHQYKTKDEIVLAAAESELGRLAAVVEAAETESSAERGTRFADRRHRRPRHRPWAQREHHPQRSRDRRILRRVTTHFVTSCIACVVFWSATTRRRRHAFGPQCSSPPSAVPSCIPSSPTSTMTWSEPSSCVLHDAFLPCLPEPGAGRQTIAPRTRPSTRLLQVDVQMADLFLVVEREDGHRVHDVDAVATVVSLFDLVSRRDHRTRRSAAPWSRTNPLPTPTASASRCTAASSGPRETSRPSRTRPRRRTRPAGPNRLAP